MTNLTYRTASGTLIRGLNYQYDVLGMITNKALSGGASSTSTAYEYDSLNRLIREDSGDSWAEYTYDLAGNRTLVVENGVTNNCALGVGNRLASVTTEGTETQSFAYDTAGNTTNLNGMALSWDERYRLTCVDEASSLVEYEYDVLGRKISRTEGSDEEHYIYNGNQIAADLDGNGNLLRTYTWGPGIDNLLSMTVHGTTETHTYYAYGNTQVFNASGMELWESAYGNRYTFQGREIDWTTGLYYFRARWYNPETGRWLSKDPIGISGGLNLYVFCGNNPVNFIDPFGLVDTNLSGESEADEYGGQWGYYDVAVHGNESGQFSDASGNPISVSDVYSQMLVDGYEPGTPINLISCYAGKDGGDAEKLANMANATVKAATGTVTLPFKPHLINPKTGKPITNPRKQETTGKWVKKKPCSE